MTDLAIAAEPTRRERRKAQTRRQLLDAARTLFVKRGYDATRPQDIARAADVAVGTFYLYYTDKRAVFLAFTDEAAHELMECVRARAAGANDFALGLMRSLEAIIEYSEAHPGVLAAAFADAAVLAAHVPEGSSLRDRLALTLAQALREGMLRGELRSDYDPAVIAHGIVGLVQQGLRFGSHGGVERRALLENLVRFCARALVTPSGVTHEEIQS
ncbi:MAG: TetR/AcrR family transcriptional regulator [Solirubrobacteraceae bacterium]